MSTPSHFRVSSSIAGLTLLSLSMSTALAAPLPGGTLDPLSIPKFVEPLTDIPAMPRKKVIKVKTKDQWIKGHWIKGKWVKGYKKNGKWIKGYWKKGKWIKGYWKKGRKKPIDYYEVEATSFNQQVLPSVDSNGDATGLPTTTVFGYGSVGKPSTRHYPGYTFETNRNRAVRVKWFNNLKNPDGTFLPHIFPLDQTIHWANPAKDCETGAPRTDCVGVSPAPYAGPIPVTNHLHGAHVGGESDGYPESWMLPSANNIPANYATKGTLFDQFIKTNTDPGTAIFQYPNDQRSTALWYHDHTLGMTRLNVHAGLAGFWMIRDRNERKLRLPGPYPKRRDRGNKKYQEIPLFLQDHSFNQDGSFFFPESRAFFDGFVGPYKPDPTSDVSPIWNPEFFGNTIVVNGKTWPFMNVEPKKYRLRLLNGSNARFMILKMNKAGLNFKVIGSDGGLLPNTPVIQSDLFIAPSERYDVIVDFSSQAPGSQIILQNVGPDSPSDGKVPAPADVADPQTTGQVMAFNVVPLTKRDRSRSPTKLSPIKSLGVATNIRNVTLNEVVSTLGDFPIAALLGTAADGALKWGDMITENPQLNEVEEWRVANLTVDAHPIHVHQVQFRVIERIPFDGVAFEAAQQAYIAGGKQGPEPQSIDYRTGPAIPATAIEKGWKDTVISAPGEITIFKVKFDIEGLYVWHCHILDHEDNEMMRPLWVGNPANSPIPVSPTAN